MNESGKHVKTFFMSGTESGAFNMVFDALEKEGRQFHVSVHKDDPLAVGVRGAEIALEGYISFVGGDGGKIEFFSKRGSARHCFVFADSINMNNIKIGKSLGGQIT